MLQDVAVVWMPVEDIERAKGSYRDTLGLSIHKEDGSWAEVDANGLTICLNGREPGGTEVVTLPTPSASCSARCDAEDGRYCEGPRGQQALLSGHDAPVS